MKVLHSNQSNSEIKSEKLVSCLVQKRELAVKNTFVTVRHYTWSKRNMQSNDDNRLKPTQNELITCKQHWRAW